MTQIEQVKAEIERLITKHSGKEGCDEAAIELDNLLSFIEELEKEQDCNGEVDDDALTKQLKIWFEKGKAQARDEFNNLPKIKGWVARDKDGENPSELAIFTGLSPNRLQRAGWWENRGDSWMAIPDDMFPDIKWEDDPVEVELIIKRI